MINLDSSIVSDQSYWKVKINFTQPYIVGCCLIKKALSLVNNEGYSLKNRVSCITLGVTFLFPLVNTIIYVSIQIFSPGLIVRLLSSDLLDILDEWAASGSVIEHRAEARKKFLEYYQRKEFGLDSYSALNKLSLQSLHLRSLPEIFHIKHFSTLQILDLRDNFLQSLPDTIENLSELQILNLNRNALQLLPDTIGNLSQLKYLLLDNNQLNILPDSIKNLSRLQAISLQQNMIRDLPDSFFTLKNLQECNLVGNSLTREERRVFLRRAAGRFHISTIYGEEDQQIHFEKYERCITELCRKGQVNEEKFLEILLLDNTTQGNLIKFIHKLTSSLIYRGEKGKSTARFLLQCLHLSCENQEFLNVFSELLAAGALSCADQVALNVNALYLQYCLHTEFPKGMSPVDFVIGLKRMDLLRLAAGKLVKDRNSHDPVEVYLALEVMLKNKLNLPSFSDELMFFKCSDLTQADLDEQEKEVLAETQDAFQILTDPHSTVFPIWNEYLEKRYRKDIDAITDQYDYSDPENLPSYGDEQEMKQQIIELKKQKTRDLIRQSSVNSR